MDFKLELSAASVTLDSKFQTKFSERLEHLM